MLKTKKFLHSKPDILRAKSYVLSSRYRKGQVMILTVLALGGAVLGATTIAGLLMLYQIREATDLANSGKAVYAADAGIERTLYNWFCAGNGRSPCPAPAPVFSNGASVVTSKFCFDGSGNQLNPCDANTNASTTTFKALGKSGNSSRAFGLSF